jgi:hypothetical protein
VGVEVSDPAGLTKRFAWTIVVTKPAPPLSLAEANLPEAVAPSLPLLNETEVWAWLEAQRQAWREKNVDTLVELGVVAG